MTTKDEAALKLRVRRQMLMLSLPPEQVTRVDVSAAKGRRSRAIMMEVILEESCGREVLQEEASY